ncbi:MAG: recombinase family protein [Clostridiales bacterium]|nr:recombinase family protein [Clostridiales bacterium]
MENKIFAYMRISTNHQRTDRQQQTIIEYSVNNGFNIDEFVSDVITGGTKADNRPNYHNMKKQLRTGDILVISDVDRLGRNADDVIVEIKDLQAKGIRVVALDVPFLNDWEKMNNDSLSKMIIDIFVTLKAHIAQQEKEKMHDRVMQGLDVAKAKGKKLGRPATGVPKEFIKEYSKFQSGEYGSISVVQFAKLQGIAVSTFYKYVGIMKKKENK